MGKVKLMLILWTTLALMVLILGILTSIFEHRLEDRLTSRWIQVKKTNFIGEVV